MHAISQSICAAALVLFGATLLAGAAPPPPAAPSAASRAAMEAATDRQRQAVEAMGDSIRRQVAAAQSQRAAATQNRRSLPSGPYILPLEPIAAKSELAANSCAPLSETTAQRVIHHAADRARLEEAFLRTVVERESGLNPCAVSPKGALGLLQLMPDTATELGITNPFDPQQNLDGGARFLRQLLNRYGGDVVKALAAYNAGPGAVDDYGGVPPFPETQNYIRDILARLPWLAVSP